MNMGLMILAVILVPVALAAVWVSSTIKRKVAPALVSGIVTLVVMNVVVFFAVHMHHYIGWHYIDYHFEEISGQATKSINNGSTEAFARVFQDARKGNIGTSPRKLSGTLRNLVVEFEKISDKQPVPSEVEITE
jgi:hypothetical protein